MRLLLAVFLAPWAAPAIVVLPGLIAAGGFPLRELAPVLGYGALFGYIGLVIAGLPAFYLLRRNHQLFLGRLVMVGFLAGLAVFYVFLRVLGIVLHSPSGFGWLDSIWGGALGIGVALSFGLIAGVPTRSRKGVADSTTKRPPLKGTEAVKPKKLPPSP